MRGNATVIARHLAVKAVTLMVTVVIGVYLTVLIANMGGRLDVVRRAEIDFSVSMAVYTNPAHEGMPVDVLRNMVRELSELEYARLGLDQPFLLRSLGYLTTALTLSLGRSENMTSDSGSREVKAILGERLPPTLLLFTTSSLLLFFCAQMIALSLSRQYGSPVDRVFVSLAPLSAAPGWFYGIFLILIFAAVLGVLPWGGMVRTPPPKETFAYAVSVLQHMILPVMAMFVGALFSSVYGWRTFFLIYSSEDYVDLAKAKGLPARMVKTRYILRPTLPTIVTSFLLMLITTWMGAIILESVFRWPGLGSNYNRAINLNDTPVIVGTIVIYAYLLAMTIFVLDIIYALIDPRVRVSGGRR